MSDQGSLSKIGVAPLTVQGVGFECRSLNRPCPSHESSSGTGLSSLDAKSVQAHVTAAAARRASAISAEISLRCSIASQVNRP